MNVRTHHIMWRAVPSHSFGNLILRCTQGLLSFLCIYYSLKHLPLVVVSLVTNLSPITIAILSYLVLKERLARIDVVILVVSFAGVIILILGSVKESRESHKQDEEYNSRMYWAFGALVFVPILAAVNAVNMRQMRELNENTVGAYMTFAMVAIYTPMVFAFDEGLGIIRDF